MAMGCAAVSLHFATPKYTATSLFVCHIKHTLTSTHLVFIAGPLGHGSGSFHVFYGDKDVFEGEGGSFGSGFTGTFGECNAAPANPPTANPTQVPTNLPTPNPTPAPTPNPTTPLIAPVSSYEESNE